MSETVHNEMLSFKGRPIFRKGSIIYYGKADDQYITILEVQTTKPLGDIALSEKVAVSLVATDSLQQPIPQIIKRTEQQGLYSALSLADIWLHRAADAGKK